ncbi:hypothetical protein FEM48_Zijuj09G0038700 [Ziziphus jujuba var. spinosa]|uniref:Uncharacterized protein n=1 Tax=Ziziphus jujuba var. spinosa TaxID=714518 RepID=A0A978UQR2_ZIZJJ|nr:hypothetical protein FEM48_Zijuj09G0038700 [Ziziphus jujuba var. spinosa]
MQRVNLRPKQAKSGKASSQKKGAKYQTAFRRRSDRIQNMAMPPRNEEIETVVIEDVNLNESEPAVIEERTLNENDNDEQDANMEVNEERTLSENDKEDEQHANMEEEQPEQTSSKKNMEEKIDHLVQLLESQGNAVETLNRLHVEALTKENRQLSLKLEVALAKLEAQEKGTLVFSELAEKIKDTMLMASLTRATETAITMTCEAIRSAIFSQDVVGGPGNTAKRNRANERK